MSHDSFLSDHWSYPCSFTKKMIMSLVTVIMPCHKDHELCFYYHESRLTPIWTEGGGGKMPPESFY